MLLDLCVVHLLLNEEYKIFTVRMRVMQRTVQP